MPGFNSKIALEQIGVNGARWRVGGANGSNETLHKSDAFRTAMMTGSTDYVGWWDDFFGDTMSATYQPDLSTGATAAVSAAASGKIRLATSTTDENHATVTLGLHWLVSSGPTFAEARITNVTAVTNRSVEFGLSDALLETAGEAFSSHDASIVAVADDAAVWAFNDEETVTTWKALSVGAAGTPAGTASTRTPVAATWDVLRVEVDASGNAGFFMNGVWVTTHALAVATTALLTPWLTITTQTTGDRQIDVDYLLVAGQRV